MSPTLLSKRLRSLERDGLVERRAGAASAREYHLTEAGNELRAVIGLLGMWGRRWVPSQYDGADRDAALLMWDVHRFVEPEGLGLGRVVVHFHFPDARQGKRHWWLLLSGGDVDLCVEDPGHEVDLYVESPEAVLAQVWMADRTAAEALRDGGLRLHGPRRLMRRFPAWFSGNPLAAIAAGRPPRLSAWAAECSLRAPRSPRWG